MKLLLFILSIFYAATICKAECTHTNYVSLPGQPPKEPTNWGGAKCSANITESNPNPCNLLLGGGGCFGGKCVCNFKWATPDCSYKRVDVNLPGAVQIGTSWIALPGIGNLMIGRTTAGAGQLTIGILCWVCAICACVGACIGLCADSIECGGVSAIVCFVLAAIFYCAGAGWGTAEGAWILQCEYRDTLGYYMAN